MKKISLVWITALIFIVYSISVNAWTDCTPSNCDASYTDNGVTCTGGTCYRNCTALNCTGEWTQVYSDYSHLDQADEDKVYDSTGSYTPTNTSECYKFLYDGPDDSHMSDVNPNPPTDCDVEIIGGFWDATSQSNPWFNDMLNYLGDVEGTQFDYLLKTIRAHCQEDCSGFSFDLGSTMNDYAIYCAPTAIACDPYGHLTYCMNQSCYNHATYTHTSHNYLKDDNPSSDTWNNDNDHNLYDYDGCGNSYTDRLRLYDAYYYVYSSPTYTINNDKTCDRTNEAPTASNVKVIPESPTAGDDLICNFTYSDPESFEEKDSTFEWWKNSVNQNINSQILGKGNLTVNDQWYCKVTPSDGLANGTKQQSSNTVTILSTVENPKIYVEDDLAWSYDGYYSDTEIITGFVAELSNALDNCTEDAQGYCNISITFSSDASGKLNLSDLGIYYEEQEEGVSNLTISSLTNITINQTHMVFEFIINNTGSTTLNNINWTLDAGDGSSAIVSEDTFSLASGSSAFVYVEYNYSTESNFIVNATANSGTLSSSKQLNVTLGNVTNNLDVYDFSMYNVSSTHKIFEFMIKNIAANQNLTDISWSLNTGLGTINSIYTYNLTPNNFSYVFVEYNYTQTGDFTPIASASSGSNQDSETLPTIDIPDIEASNLSLIYNDSTHRIFFFSIANMLSTPMNNVNWTFDTDGNNVISAEETFSLNESKSGWVFVEYNYSSAGTYNVNATAINGSLQDSTYYAFTIS